MIEKSRTIERRLISRSILGFMILVMLVPLFMVKAGIFVPILSSVFSRNPDYIIVPMGISFFTLQIIAYLTDIYNGKIVAQKNILKYTLFVSFFPQIIQGPIPRYEQLEIQLIEGHKFDEKCFTKGLHLIIWGFFLKLMIADKAAVITDMMFGKSAMYRGVYVLVAGSLYCVQLYTDFLSCVTLARGAAMLFGIRLENNFNHPWFSTSIKEFWGRWHISLSSWLRDYIYIPLGGNRKGTIRKYINLTITFLISGIWHGWGLQYIAWGLINVIYQIIGELTFDIQEKIYFCLGFKNGSREKRFIKMLITSLLTIFAVTIFRAETLKEGVSMVVSVFTVYNPWILFNDSLLALGYSWKEWIVLLASIGILIKVSIEQERRSISEWVIAKPLVIRWSIYVITIIVVFVYGTYGFGFNSQDFIYGGF